VDEKGKSTVGHIVERANCGAVNGAIDAQVQKKRGKKRIGWYGFPDHAGAEGGLRGSSKNPGEGKGEPSEANTISFGGVVEQEGFSGKKLFVNFRRASQTQYERMRKKDHSCDPTRGTWGGVAKQCRIDKIHGTINSRQRETEGEGGFRGSDEQEGS